MMNKKSGCRMLEKNINVVCGEYASLFSLWASEFLFDQKIYPSCDDVRMMRDFIMATDDCHVKLGCTKTPKVHLMSKHAAHHMETTLGGFGNMMEDCI